VDLPGLVQSGSAEGFLYFYAFFRRAAFDDEPLGVGALLRESTDYARSVGDSLKVQVYEALRHVAQGFLDHPGNGLSAEPETLREIYDGSLILLYRLLFVLYAESRDLLPVHENRMYRDSYSLHAIKYRLAGDLDADRTLLPTSARLWQGLRELFAIIEGGNERLGVAIFDGGLFDPALHPFLENHVVGDGHLQQAIDRLARVDGQFVDYRDLAERHLGTIFEDLLEYRLEALTEPEKGWTVALLNDRGERKATGSYYTPDYVVKYIVEATVDPLLHEAVEGAKCDREKTDAVLALNVLDPSMGSGHFLVEVVERISHFLVELGVAPEELEAGGELAYWKRRVAQSCVYGVNANPLAVDPRQAEPLARHRGQRPPTLLPRPPQNRQLPRRGAHRGAATRWRQEEEEQGEIRRRLAALHAGGRGVQAQSDERGGVDLVDRRFPADTLEDVREQERLYARLREDLTRRYTRLADLATATDFGVEVDPSLLKPLTDFATGRAPYAPPQFARWLEESEALADEKRCFHWELEVPDVFFDRQGRPLGDEAGFDAIVGNPPYVRQEALGDLKPYLAGAYPEVYHGVADLYVYRNEQGLRQLRHGGLIGFIVTNKWLQAGYREPLRGFFASEGVIEEIVDFGHAPIFEDADVFPCIVLLRKPLRDEPQAGGSVRVVEYPREALSADIATYVRENIMYQEIQFHPQYVFTQAAYLRTTRSSSWPRTTLG
jgi:Eco57I restriction-modification methylase